MQSDTYFEQFLPVTPFALAIWRSLEASFLEKYSLIGKTLDIGCGFGEFMGVFSKNTIDVGIDISQRDLAIASNRSIYKKVIPADARNMPFADNSFDSVVSVSVLEHIHNTQLAIDEAYRVLKPGGMFLLTVPTITINDFLLIPQLLYKAKLSHLAQEYIHIFHKVFKHEVLQSKQAWIKMLQQTGFTIETIESTMRPSDLRLFELTLPFSLSSNIGRTLTGNRLILDNPLRSALLRFVHKQYAQQQKQDWQDINLCIVCRK